MAQGEQQIGRQHPGRMIGCFRCRHPPLGQHTAEHRGNGRPGAGVGAGERALDAHVLDAVLQDLLQGSLPGRQGVDREVGVADVTCLVGQVAPGQIAARRVVGHVRNLDVLPVGAGLVSAYPDLDAELAAQGRRHDGQGVSQRVVHGVFLERRSAPLPRPGQGRPGWGKKDRRGAVLGFNQN